MYLQYLLVKIIELFIVLLFSLVSYIRRAVQVENQLMAKHMVSEMKAERDERVGPGKCGVLTSELLNVLLLSVHRYSTAY